MMGEPEPPDRDEAASWTPTRCAAPTLVKSAAAKYSRDESA